MALTSHSELCNVGQYTVYLPSRPERAVLMKSLLDNLQSSLKLVIQDLQLEPPSAAYSTFFKDPANRPFITTLFTNITIGVTVCPITSPPQSWARFSNQGSPLFYIITAKGQFFADPRGYQEDIFDFCQDEKYTTASVALGIANPKPFIILCPFFFQGKAPLIYRNLPPSSIDGQPASNCWTITPRNRFRKKTPKNQPAGFELTQYRNWILLEELAHLYYGASTGKSLPDQYDVKKCVRLSPDDALANGPSYAYYAAS